MTEKILDEIKKKQDTLEQEVKEVLKEEKTILKKVLEEEEEIKEEQETIEKEEVIIEKQEKLIEKDEKDIKELLQSKIITRKFNDILEWKKNIWNNCQYKVKKEKETEIDYFCKKMNSKCLFAKCPMNLS